VSMLNALFTALGTFGKDGDCLHALQIRRSGSESQ
jgi:hypothetical protein